MKPIILATLMALIGLAPLAAQINQSAIVGTCTDPSGAAMPGASVTARNVGTNSVFRTRTNETGNYVFPSLPVGAYEITVTAHGFKTAVRPEIPLQVGDRARADFILAIGVAEQKVEITGEAPLVQTDISGLGQVIENRRITELPLNGRNAMSLALIAPGVQNLNGGINLGFGLSANFQAANIGINGSRGGHNAFLLDGGLNTNPERNEVTIAPLVEAVAEFKVMTSFLPPEYGLTGGGVINTVSKSGSNELHGSAYEFLRNDKLDARNAFAETRAPFRYNQFGAALGAPVWLPKVYRGRDRTFFFFNFEIARYRNTVNPITSVPTAAQRGGDFSELRDARGRLVPVYDTVTTRANPSGSGFVRDVFPGNVVPKNRFDPVAVNVLPFLPLPNRAPSDPFTNSLNYIGAQRNPVDTSQYHARIDHTISQANRIFGRWSTNKQQNMWVANSPPWPDEMLYARVGRGRYQQALISDQHTFAPTVLNEFRFTANRQGFPFTPPSYNQGWPQKLGLPASVPPTLFPVFRVAGLSPLGNANSYGLRYVTTWQMFDMVTKVQGNHTMKFGFEGRLLRESNFQVSSPSGSFTFAQTLTGNPQAQAGTGSGLATFLLGAVSTGSLQVFTSPTNIGHTYGLFAGDDWKVTRRLTVNLGIRYDFQSPPIERRRRSSNFNPLAPNPQLPGLHGRYEFAGLDYGDTVVGNDRNDFGPRAGFALDLFGNARTILRGGYALLYTPVFSYGYFPNTAGFSVTSIYDPPGNNSNLPAFQLRDGPPFIDRPAGRAMGPTAFLGSAVSWEEGSKRTPYTQQWNLGLQRQIRGKWVVEASYAGNRGVKLLSADYQYNDLDPTYLSLGLALQDQVSNPLAGRVPGVLGGARVNRRQTLLPFPQYSGVGVFAPRNGASTYHSFLLRAERRFSNGLSLLASYTNAKLITDSGLSLLAFMGIPNDNAYQSYQSGKYNRRAERAVDPVDIAQRLVVSYVYELPIGRGRALPMQNRAIDALVGGWSTTGLWTVQGGQPVLVRGANNFLANRPNSTGKTAKLEERKPDGWFDTAQFANPPNFTFGNLGRTLPDVRGPGLFNVDFGLLKTQKLREWVRLQFRAEAFNLFNRTHLGVPGGGFTPGPDGRNVNATLGKIYTAWDPRTLQFGLKVLW